MALCNLTLFMFCLFLEIWCRFQFSHSRLASWNTSYHNLQNADRDTVKMSTISVRLCPQKGPQTSHDESRHTSVEALMWRWTLCCQFFLDSLNFLNYSSHTKIALQNACKRRLCIDMRALPVLYRVRIAKTVLVQGSSPSMGQDTGETTLNVNWPTLFQLVCAYSVAHKHRMMRVDTRAWRPWCGDELCVTIFFWSHTTFWIITIIRSNLHLRPSSPLFAPAQWAGAKTFSQEQELSQTGRSLPAKTKCWISWGPLLYRMHSPASPIPWQKSVIMQLARA